jgi:adenylate cyclase
MNETRKLAAILVSDVVGYARLTGADEERILARLRTLRSDLIDQTIAVHHGRYVAFQMAEVAVPRHLFVDILRLIAELRPPRSRQQRN